MGGVTPPFFGQSFDRMSGRYRRGSATRTFSTPCATRSLRRIGSGIFGAIEIRRYGYRSRQLQVEPSPAARSHKEGWDGAQTRRSGVEQRACANFVGVLGYGSFAFAAKFLTRHKIFAG